MKPVHHKNAKRYNDEMFCSHCGKSWDVNDPEPPPCKTGNEWLREIRNKIGSAGDRNK